MQQRQQDSQEKTDPTSAAIDLPIQIIQNRVVFHRYLFLNNFKSTFFLT